MLVRLIDKVHSPWASLGQSLWLHHRLVYHEASR
jgi:hypothetical protein